MEAKSNNGSASEQSSQPANDPQLSTPDELISFAQEYFSSDFPNAERLGCPKVSTFSDLLRAGKVPDEPLRAHLFGCSECFQEYRVAMKTRRSVASLANVAWMSRLKVVLIQQRTPVFAGAFSLVLLCFIGAYVWQKSRAVPAPSLVQNRAASANTTDDSSTADNTSVTPGSVTESASRPEQRTVPVAPTNQGPVPAQQRLPTDQSPREIVAMNTVKVDLEDYTALRGGAGGGEAQAIRLSPRRTRLLLTLPEGSVEGSYHVSIVDTTGKSLVTANARSADGKAIAATLDLQKLPVQKYRLRISHEGEVPGYYPIIVETQKPTSRVKRY